MGKWGGEEVLIFSWNTGTIVSAFSKFKLLKKKNLSTYWSNPIIAVMVLTKLIANEIELNY